jgi:hypothetical protein
VDPDPEHCLAERFHLLNSSVADPDPDPDPTDPLFCDFFMTFYLF